MSFAVRKFILSYMELLPSVERRRQLRTAINALVAAERADPDSACNALLYEFSVLARSSLINPESGAELFGYRDPNVRLARELQFWAHAMDVWEIADVYASPRGLGWCAGAEVRAELTGSEVAGVVASIRAKRAEYLTPRQLEAIDRQHPSYPFRVVDPAVFDVLNRCADPEVTALFADAELQPPRESSRELRPGDRAFWLEFIVLPDGIPVFVAHAFQRDAVFFSGGGAR